VHTPDCNNTHKVILKQRFETLIHRLLLTKVRKPTDFRHILLKLNLNLNTSKRLSVVRSHTSKSLALTKTNHKVNRSHIEIKMEIKKNQCTSSTIPYQTSNIKGVTSTFTYPKENASPTTGTKIQSELNHKLLTPKVNFERHRYQYFKKYRISCNLPPHKKNSTQPSIPKR
jgi:hypothetical protein